MFRYVASLLFVALSTTSALATGWNDFSIDIGGGYTIFRPYAGYIGLDSPTHGVLYEPNERTGPISGYVVAPERILLRTVRNPPGASYTANDACLFYVVDKSHETLAGPFTHGEFAALNVSPVRAESDWIVPKNPHPEVALAGQRAFIVISLAIYAVVFGLPMLPAVLIIYAVVRVVRRRSKPRSA